MGKRIFLDGKLVSCLKDLPEGSYDIFVTERACVYDLPEHNIKLGSSYFSRSEVMSMIRGLLSDEKKIPAIKLVRAVTAWGLRESKKFVDDLIELEY